LSNKGAMKFTIAKYYTPNEYVIHDAGIEPDIRVTFDANDKKRIRKQIRRYPGVVKPDVDRAIVDVQLKRAMDVLRAVMIYKESGI